MYVEVEEYTPSLQSLQETIKKIQHTLPYDLGEELTGYDTYFKQKKEILAIINKLKIISNYREDQIRSSVLQIVTEINNITEKVFQFDLPASLEIIDVSLGWSKENANTWYLRGKIHYQLYTRKKSDDLNELLNDFQKAIDLSEDIDELSEITFWSYVLLGNIHLYLILSDKEAVNHVLKYYNVAYRYAMTHNVTSGQKLIFRNVELLQQIIIDKFPLLVLVYNQSGYKIFEYMFELIEVIADDKWMIPNLTALLSAVDDRIKEMFKANIGNAYFVMENRLMVLSTIHEKDEDWIKVAYLFAYLDEFDDDIIVDQSLLHKIIKFNKSIISDDEIKNYLINFYGKIEDEITKKIKIKIGETFEEEDNF